MDFSAATSIRDNTRTRKFAFSFCRAPRGTLSFEWNICFGKGGSQHRLPTLQAVPICQAEPSSQVSCGHLSYWLTSA